MPNTKGVRVANMTPDNFNATIRSLESDMPPPDAIGFNIGLKIADLGETNYSAFLDQLDPLCNEFEVGVTLNVGLKVGDVADMDYPNYYRTLTELCETYGIPMSVGVSGKFSGNTVLHPEGRVAGDAGDDAVEGAPPPWEAEGQSDG